ncbi:hypothetical protein NDU88_006869 [Pleurodeles waltl]|uniref:Uncharacterized protein n=1 Tax=Pleurodeles waltl TaxID=8319 RepID=A0AAV7RT89_PLEWA|nr:hypothetical protein NDU88_006869 [Pleurodeles waltl]
MDALGGDLGLQDYLTQTPFQQKAAPAISFAPGGAYCWTSALCTGRAERGLGVAGLPHSDSSAAGSHPCRFHLTKRRLLSDFCPTVLDARGRAQAKIGPKRAHLCPSVPVCARMRPGRALSLGLFV